MDIDKRVEDVVRTVATAAAGYNESMRSVPAEHAPAAAQMKIASELILIRSELTGIRAALVEMAKALPRVG